MKINFTSLMYFQKVAELEHLTKAAEALHIAQPALSRTIRSMEEELDVSLFTHQGRNIHLTRDGHILLKYTNKILGSLDDLRQELQDSRDLQQLTVKLAIMSSSRLIPAFLMKFKEEYPETILEIVPQNSDSANASRTDLTLFCLLRDFSLGKRLRPIARKLDLPQRSFSKVTTLIQLVNLSGQV